MPRGTLEVHLVGAKGLENTDFLGNMDPYVVLTCRTQEQRSSVATGQGTAPKWNENFLFTISEGTSEIKLKILDSDMASNDDFVGQSTVPLEAVFMKGSLPATAYNVVKDQQYQGEIRVGLTFKPQESRSYGSLQMNESIGGWKESSY
ncbi:hypothetical protein ACOSP7_023834 [Xanthoceras sorbifolium]